MDLNHRLVSGSGDANSLGVVLRQFKYPLTLVFPISIGILSLISAWPMFGQAWVTGSISLVFVPFVGSLLTPFLSGENNLGLSTVVLIGYILTPVSFYCYVYFVTRRHLAALVAGLFLILPILPISTQPSERLLLALADKDGGHILGLAILPLITIFYHQYIRTGKKLWQIAVLAGSGLLGLISFFAFLVELTFFLLTTLSEILIGSGKIKFRRFMETTVLLIIVFGVIYNVSLITMLVSDAGKTTVAVILNLLPLSFFIVPVVGTFAFLIFDRRPKLQLLFLSLGGTLVFGLLQGVRVTLVDVSILKQSRYAAELSMSSSFLGGVVAVWIFEMLRSGQLLQRYPQLVSHRDKLAWGFAAVIIFVLTGSILLIPRSL